MTSKKTAAATPFDQLLGLAPARLPKTTSAVLVVDGEKVENRWAARRLAAGEADPDDDPDAARLIRERLTRELDRVKAAKRYQAERLNPEAMARRQAWSDAHREERREYLQRWREQNREQWNKLQADWARRKYHADPEAARAKQREYYAKNREAILARLADKKARQRAMRSTEAAQKTDTTQPPSTRED